MRIGVWNSKKPCPFMRARSESITRPRSMMLLCSRSRRRSRKRYCSRVSSGYSWSVATGSGSSAAGPEHLDLGDVELDLPVGMSAFSVPAGRRRTWPSTRTTHSERSFSASAKAGESGSTTHCVMP